MTVICDVRWESGLLADAQASPPARSAVPCPGRSHFMELQAPYEACGRLTRPPFGVVPDDGRPGRHSGELGFVSFGLGGGASHRSCCARTGAPLLRAAARGNPSTACLRTARTECPSVCGGRLTLPHLGPRVVAEERGCAGGPALRLDPNRRSRHDRADDIVRATSGQAEIRAKARCPTADGPRSYRSSLTQN